MTQRMFGIKDLFTTINVVAGFLALVFCIENEPLLAGVSVILGYVLGDVPDGWVARKLGTSNKFGSEYDVIADHLAHVIAPAAIIYVVYTGSGLLSTHHANQVLGAVLGATIVVSSSIRHARNTVQSVEFTGIWSGLPRTVLGFVAIGFVLSETVHARPATLWIGVAFIPMLSVATLSRFPFANHRLPRRYPLWVRLSIALFLLSTPALLFVELRYGFDALFGWMLVYLVSSYLVLKPDEVRGYRDALELSTQSPQT